MLVDSSVGAIRDPERADLVALTGELSSQRALSKIHSKMLESKTGNLILQERPRVDNTTWNLDELVKLDKNTFGHQYASFMLDNGFKSNDRPICQVVQDIELAYVMQRYREVHDSFHVLFGFGTTVSEELAVKWYEMSILGLPSASLSSFFGPLILVKNRIQNQNPTELKNYMNNLLPHVNKCLAQSKDREFIMNIYFEKEFETDIEQLRQRVGIVKY